MQGLIYALDVFVVLTVALGLLFGLRWKYMRDVAPSPKHPHGKMIAEFLPEVGPRYRQLVEILANGNEIKVPAGHKSPRYFFNKSAQGTAKYPTQPLLPISWVQVDAPIVSWYKDCPEPIPAALSAYSEKPTKNTGKDKDGNHIIFLRPQTIATAEMLDLIRDTDSLALAGAVNEEMAQTQEELQKAIANKMDKRIVYAGLAVAAIGALLGAIFAYQALSNTASLVGG